MTIVFGSDRIWFYSGKIERARLGFPEWRKVSNWLNTELSVVYPLVPNIEELEVKNPEVPELTSYEEEPHDEFLKFFPKRDLPGKVTTRVNVTALRKRMLAVKKRMARTEFNQAKRVLRNLQHGAGAYQYSELPPISTRNSKSAAVHG